MPIIVASRGGNVAIVRALLQANADPNVRRKVCLKSHCS